MDYSSQLLQDSNVFADSSTFINLKLKSPSPLPFNSPNNNNNNNDNNNDSYDKTTPEPQSPTKRGSKLGKSENVNNLEDSVSSLNDQITSIHLKTISKFDIYKKLLSQVMGKDRIAKILYYLLNLIKYYLITTRRYIVDEKFTDLSLNPLNHYKSPIKYLKLLLFLNSNLFEKKISIITENLSIFRFALRFGGTPHRIRGALLKFNEYLKNPTFKNFETIFINESFLGDFINLYYGITDELFLLFKLKLLNNQTLRKLVGRHIDLAWLYDVIFGLKKNYDLLVENKNKQLQLNIQYQVRKKANQLSKNLLENIGNNNSPLKLQILKEFNNKSTSSNNNLKEIENLKHEEKIIKLDLLRLTCDLVCVSIDVWGLKLGPTVYSWSGLASGLTGFTKIWITTVKELQES